MTGGGVAVTVRRRLKGGREGGKIVSVLELNNKLHSL